MDAEERPSWALVVTVVLGSMLGFMLISFAFKIRLYEKKVLLSEENTTFKHRLNVADDMFSAVFFPIMAYLAISGFLELWREGTVEARWKETTSRSYWFLMLYVSRMTLHIPVQTLLHWEDDKVLLAQLTAHHIFSAICFGVAMYSEKMHFWGLFAGCCEITTGPLAVVCLSLNCFPREDSIANIVTAIAGFLLWLGFLLFRIMLFPVWMFLFCQDIVNYPSETWYIMTAAERVCYPAVILMLWVLSCMWMVPITRGLLKVMGSLNLNDEMQKEDEPLLQSPAITKRNSYASPMVNSRNLPVLRKPSFAKSPANEVFRRERYDSI